MAGRSLIPIYAVGTTFTAVGHSLSALRLKVNLLFSRRTGSRRPVQCLLDTGAPLSVVPYPVHQGYALAWQPVVGPWPLGFTHWYGVPCTVGIVEAWVSVPQAPFFRGPLAFVAKFVQGIPAQMSPALPVLLGLNFLADHGAEVSFECHRRPNAGAIMLP